MNAQKGKWKLIPIIIFLGLFAYMGLSEIRNHINTIKVIEFFIFCVGFFVLYMCPSVKTDLNFANQSLIMIISTIYIQWFVLGDARSQYLWLSLVIVFMTGIVIFFVIQKALFASAVNATFYMLWIVANELVTQVRHQSIMPSDIKSFPTAVAVANSYVQDFTVNHKIVIAVLATIVLWAASVKIKGDETGRKTSNRFLSLLIVGVIYIALVLLSPADYKPGEYYSEEKVASNGYIPVFYLELQNGKIKKPEGYSKEGAAKALTKDSNVEIAHSPNVIVVLDEAFSDLYSVGDLSTNRDALEYVHSLGDKQGFHTGYVYVPTWAVNTCNTEWELLTGNSMVMCKGKIPFTQFISSKTDSLAQEFIRHGYETVGVHPFYEEGYKRSKVYPLLGFKRKVFLTDFDNRYSGLSFTQRLSESDVENDPRYIRDLISDKTSFDKVIEIYEESSQKGAPLFVFNLTMQNHGPYTYQDYLPGINADLGDQHPDKVYVDQYLSVVRETDRAISELIEYFSQVEEETIILICGDHQPGIGDAFYNTIYGYPIDKSSETWTEEEKRKKYLIPYVLWSNFDCSLEHDYEFISSNYLYMMVLDAAGFDTSGWYEELNTLYTKYPVISPCGIMKADGEWFPSDDSLLNEDPDLNRYWQLQYFRMFDEYK